MLDFNLALEKEVLDEVGARIRALRKQAGMSQQDLADQIGISRRSVGEMERGGNTSLSVFIRILKTFGRIQGLDDLLRLAEISPRAAFESKSGKQS